MRYCTMELQKGPDGWAPNFPDGVGFLLLGDPGGESTWGLYAYTVNDAHREWHPDDPIGPELAALIESARRYAPALALARDKITDLFSARMADRAEFLAAFQAALTAYLRALPDSGYLMAPAVREEVGYLVPGEWYWILGFTSSRQDSVRWVSDDFFVYTNPNNHFDLTEGRLERLHVENNRP